MKFPAMQWRDYGFNKPWNDADPDQIHAEVREPMSQSAFDELVRNTRLLFDGAIVDNGEALWRLKP